MKRTIRIAWLCSIGLLQVSSTTAHAEWALAVSQTSDGAWAQGNGFNYDDRDVATNTALSACEPHGSYCKIIAEGTNGCVAFSVAFEGNGYTWAKRSSLGAALTAAMVGCTKSNPTGCQIQAQFCDRTNNFKEENMTAADKAKFEEAVESARLYRAQSAVQQGMQDFVGGFVSGLSSMSPAPAAQPQRGPVYTSPPTRSGSSNCAGPAACSVGN
jgi:Domain of unknown function (DUF4189)